MGTRATIPETKGRPIPAIVTAGDRGAAKAVHGESKVYLEVGGRPMIAHVVAALQRVPEISSVWVVGDRERLGAVLAAPELQDELRKPLHVIPQFDNLYENAWETFKRTLPGADAEGREPESVEDQDWQVLYLSADLPFISPQEISEFIRRGQELGCEYAIGLSDESALDLFHPGPAESGREGVEVTYFNLREARLKQNNLHLAKPARILNRRYVQDMYEHRKQKELANMISLAWRLLWDERGGASLVSFYWVIHFAGVLDRWHLRTLADLVRRIVSVARVERAIARIMKTDARLVVLEVGGCAIDVDTEEEYDVIRANFERLSREQRARAEAALGPLPLPERAGEP